jgi:AraC-like DNA-binding protein
MEKAKSLLADHQLSINIVASKLGFNYPNHFTRFFRNAAGMSPSEFRQSL